MTYLVFEAGKGAVSVFDEYRDAAGVASQSPGKWYETSWDWRDYETACDRASAACKLSGELYLPCDRGEWVSPRYDVVKAPKVGDKVSYAFNGDYYPCGEVVAVTAGTARIVKTSTGKTFYRRKLTSAWIMQGGTWSLIPGWKSELNPSF